MCILISFKQDKHLGLCVCASVLAIGLLWKHTKSWVRNTVWSVFGSLPSLGSRSQYASAVRREKQRQMRKTLETDETNEGPISD